MSEFTNHLDWQAFRYVAGEMEMAEVVKFEACLEQDQFARDAVVRAMEISQSVLMVEQQNLIESNLVAKTPAVLPANQKAWSYPLAWFAAGVAACLCLIWSFPWLNSSRPSVSTELAEAWGTQLESMDVTSSVSASEEALPEQSESETNFISEVAPTWMVEAIRISEKSNDQDDSAIETMES